MAHPLPPLVRNVEYRKGKLRDEDRVLLGKALDRYFSDKENTTENLVQHLAENGRHTFKIALDGKGNKASFKNIGLNRHCIKDAFTEAGKFFSNLACDMRKAPKVSQLMNEAAIMDNDAFDTYSNDWAKNQMHSLCPSGVKFNNESEDKEKKATILISTSFCSFLLPMLL